MERGGGDEKLKMQSDKVQNRFHLLKKFMMRKRSNEKFRRMVKNDFKNGKINPQ